MGEGQGEHQWAQVRLGADDYLEYPNPVVYRLRENRENHLWAVAADDDQQITIQALQSEAWPVRSEFPLEVDEDAPQKTGLRLSYRDDSMPRWVSVEESRLLGVEVSADRKFIEGRFSATLEQAEDPSETREVEGAFRGGLAIECVEQVG
ncbi:MAG: hypothetical protein ACOCV2_05965, partial [Persicimonas sp.]